MNGHVRVALVAALVCAISVAVRVVVVSTTVAPPLRIFGQTDVYEVWRATQLDGHRLPYWDVPFWYPPVIGYVSGLISLVVDSPRAFLIGWGLVVTASGAALGYALSRAAGARRALVYFALSPQLLLLSGINFDVLPAALATGAVLSARAARPAVSLAYAAVATATKLYAAAFAPVIVLRDARTSRAGALLGAAVFVVVFAVVYGPALAAPFSQLKYTQEYATQVVPNFDSIWRVPYELLRAVGADATTIVLAATTLGMVLTYVLLVLPRAMRARDAAVGCGLALVTVLLWNRFYSPQYEIWLLPFFALLAIPVRTFVLLTVADVIGFFVIFTMSLVLPPGDPLLDTLLPVLVAVVVLRHIALIVLWRDMAKLARS